MPQPPTLSPLTWDELRHLVEWPAELLYSPGAAVAGDSPDTSYKQLAAIPISDRYRTKGEAPLDPDFRKLRSFDPGPSIFEIRRQQAEASATVTMAPEQRVSRPNRAAYWNAQPQTFQPNPYPFPEFNTDYSNYSEIDPDAEIDGAEWAIGEVSRKIFNANLISRSTITILTPSGAMQTLRGHALREEPEQFVDAAIEAVYQQYRDLELDKLARDCRWEIQRWQDIGKTAVISPEGVIDRAVSLANALTAQLVISKILEKLAAVNGFIRGAETLAAKAW